jgi:hypothetical protein
MSRNRKIVIASVLVVVLGAIAWALFRAPSVHEPVYAGKTLNEWLEVYDPGHAILLGKEWEETDAAIRNMDTNAIPFLLQMLRSHDSDLKLRFVKLAQKQQFFKVRFVDASILHHRAEIGLKLLGPRAEVAVPALLEIYDRAPSMDSQQAAARVLSQFTTPPLKNGIPLKHLDPESAPRATSTLLLHK